MNAESPTEQSREELIALVAALRAQIAELERRLGLNSSNSGKPPSSDGLKKPARVSSLRERSGKKPGGQKGHKGETLRQVTDPNEVVNHYPPACSMCGEGLDPETSVGHSTRQVFDLPQPQPLVVTEHRAHDLPMPCLWRQDTRAISRRRQRARAIWCQNHGLRDLSVALSVAAREPPGRTDGRPVRRQSGRRDDRENESDFRPTSAGLCCTGARF